MSDPGIYSELADLLAGDEVDAKVRTGTITAVDLPNGKASVSLGNAPASLTGIRCLAPYFPAVGDTVLVLRRGPGRVILGKLNGTGGYPVTRLGHHLLNGASGSMVVTTTDAYVQNDLGTELAVTCNVDANRLIRMAFKLWAMSANSGEVYFKAHADGVFHEEIRFFNTGTANGATPQGSYLFTGLAAGSHTFKVQVRTLAGTANLARSGGTNARWWMAVYDEGPT